MTDTFNVDNAALDDIPLTCAAQPIELDATKTHWVFNPPLPIEVVSAVLEEIQGVCDCAGAGCDCPLRPACPIDVSVPAYWDVDAIVTALQAHREASHE